MRFIGKLEAKIKELDGLHNQVNDVYSSGAVEGYTSQKLEAKVVCVGSNMLKANKNRKRKNNILQCFVQLKMFGLLSSIGDPSGMRLHFVSCTSRLQKRGSLNMHMKSYEYISHRDSTLAAQCVGHWMTIKISDAEITQLCCQLRGQDSLTLESRAKTIPLPKAKAVPKPGAKSQAKAKPKAKAAASPQGEDENPPPNAG